MTQTLQIHSVVKITKETTIFHNFVTKDLVVIDKNGAEITIQLYGKNIGSLEIEKLQTQEGRA